MVLSASEDPMYRPVGTGKVKRRFFSARQLGLILLVLVLGGGGGTAAYFLSDMDLRDLIGMLDIADPGGTKLTFLIPGTEDQEAAKPPSAEPGDLLTPPGGPVHRPEPEAIAIPAPPPPSPPALPAVSAEKPVPAHETPVAPAATASEHAPKSAFDPKMFEGIIVPPPLLPAQPVPPPTPRAVDQVPSFVSLSERRPDMPLTPAPDKTLLGNSAHGPVPIVAADGRKPWKVYAKPYEGPKDQPHVAMIVSDLGLDSATTEAAIARLPGDVTLAFSPYGLELSRWIAKARESGHEALIVLPVDSETMGGRDPGPLGLSPTLGDKENLARLETILSRAPGVVGVLVPQESFLSHGQGVGVLAALLQRGLIYVGPALQGSRVPPSAVVNDVVDHAPWRSAISARLDLALGNSKSLKNQVLIASPRPVSLEMIAPWLDGLDAQGVASVPVTAIVAP